jgi:CO/xanthine dehydrogenase Mo-binding subunit
MNFRDLSRNVMARGKALYEGHAVAAVGAVSPSLAAEALELIEVEYELLPHVIDVEEAMADGAPTLHDDLFTQGIDPKPEKPSNVAKRISFAKGDAAAGFRQADVIIERRYTTKAGASGLYASRMPALSRWQQTDEPRSGARAKASSWSALIAPN